jgi:hypothetical protein
LSKQGLKMAPDEKAALAAVMEEIKKLSTQVEDLKAKVEGEKKGSDKEAKASDSDLAYAAALLPLYGMTFASPLFLPFGLRLAAARALVLHRALARAAKVTGELVKAGDGTGQKPDVVDQLFEGILSRSTADREAVAKFVRSVWRGS